MNLNNQIFTGRAWRMLMLFILISFGAIAQTPIQKNGQLRVIGTKLCNQYGNPIQLRGMSTHGIQWYYQCLTDASLDALAYNWGADILRISLYVQEGGYETDPVGFTAKVTDLINKATARGMYALVDWHQLTPGDPNANLENAKRFFTDIANAHKNKTNIIYDICNEPNGVAWSRIKTYADQIIPVIRAIDSDAPIFIGTHGWGSLGISDGRTAQDIVSLPVNFTNIMYTFHFYAASHADRYLQELDWASDRLPIFVTEFGTQEASGDGPNNFTMAQRYMDLMRTKKIGWTNWNFSDDFRSGAVWNTGTCSGNTWTTAQLKPAGSWVRDRMLSPADDFPGGNNVAPTVSISSPANNSTYTAPATITFNVNASDSDGSIARVEFYRDGVNLGNDTSSPYSFNWLNVAAGTYSLTAKAIDNLGAETTSSSISVVVNTGNTLPTPWANRDIGSVSPVGNASYSSGTFTLNGAGADIWGTADAFHYAYRSITGDVEITARVTSLANTNAWAKSGLMIRESLNANSIHASALLTPSSGTGLQRRIATGGESAHTGSTGAAPLWLRLKRTGSTFTAFKSSDGTTWTSIGSVAINMSSTVYVGLAVTSHANGTLASSVFSNVTVITPTTNNPPSVTIATPSSGTSYTSPATIVINANASDTDGTVTQVAFYNGSNPLGTDTSSPYSFTWSNVTAGSYSITARATDNNGATTTSSVVNLTVTGGTSDNCSSITQYQENGGYTAGSIVKNNGSSYECKPYPYSGWCNGSAWAYAPGSGTYWQDAWILKGSCSAGARMVTDNHEDDSIIESDQNGLSVYPNPAKNGLKSITLRFENAPELINIHMRDISGAEIFSQSKRGNKSKVVRIETPHIPGGLYIIRVSTEGKSWVKKYLVQE